MPKVEPRRLPPGVQRKRAKGRTYYYFHAGTTNAGKTVLKRLPDILAIEFGPAYAAAMHARGRMKATVAAALTVNELAERWEKSPELKKKKPNTRKTYAIYLPSFTEQFGHAPANEIARADVLALIDTFGERTGAANMTLSVVGALYAWGRRRGLVTINPTADIEAFDTKDYEPWPDELLEAALTDNDRFIQTSVALLYYTAQRIGDVSKMRWTDFQHGRVTVVQEKTGAELDFPIHARLRQIIGPPVAIGFVLSQGAKGYAASTIRGRIQEWATAKGFKIVPHGLRKNAVNALLEAGCTVAETSSISGQSLQIVEHYAKRRNRSKLGSAALLRWEGNAS